MNNTIILLRHGETDKDKDGIPKDWHLTKSGKEEAEEASKKEIFNNIDIIFSSTENKAKETTKPFAKKNNIKIIENKGLNEINRNAGKFIEKDKFIRENGPFSV